MTKAQHKKWNAILKGQRTICGDGDLDSFPFHIDLATIHNPDQVGTLDTWVAFLVT